MGHREGILFYVAERETSYSKSDSPKEEAKAPIDCEDNLPEEKIALPPAPDIDFSTIPSFQSIKDDGPDLQRLYSFLREKRVVANADENRFIQYVTHAYFSPLYLEGNRLNILYVIRRLKDYYTNDWLDAVCDNLNIDADRVTKRLPSDKFTSGFPSLTIKK